MTKMRCSKRKRLARRAVRNAIKEGSLKRPINCSKCHKISETKIQAHHIDGYEEKDWLNIRWLCEVCHARYH